MENSTDIRALFEHIVDGSRAINVDSVLDSMHSLYHNDEGPERHEAALQASLDYLNTVQTSLRSLDSVLGYAKEALRVERQSITSGGIFSLPPELLSRIMETACALSEDSDIYPTLAIALSHVCSQFRGVALATPRLWCRVHSNHPLAMTKVLLDISGDVPLAVIIYRRDGDDWGPFMLEACRHCHRWGELAVDERSTGHFRVNEYDYPPGGYSYNLPVLSKLTLQGTRVPEWLSARFSFPDLQELALLEHSILGLESVLKPSCKSCEVRFPAQPLDVSLDAMFRSLGKATSLRTLLLGVFDPTASVELEFPRLAGSRHLLPALRKLVVYYTLSSPQSVGQLFTLALDMPLLEQFEIAYIDQGSVERRGDIQGECQSMNFLPSLYRANRRYPSLKNFDLSYSGQYGAESGDEIERIISCMPVLESLTIRGASLLPLQPDSFTPTPRYELPDLRRLTYKHMPKVDFDYFSRLLQAFKDAGRWRAFEELSVYGCSQINAQAAHTLSEMMEGKRFHYEPF